MVAKDDFGKLQLTLVPREIIRNIATIRMYGNAKYPDGGVDNWKSVSPERYRDALFRHLLAYLDDPNGCDAESGYPHLWHIACNVAFLCEFAKEDSVHWLSERGDPRQGVQKREVTENQEAKSCASECRNQTSGSLDLCVWNTTLQKPTS